MIELLFWISLATIVYAYIGYPLLMWFISFFVAQAKLELPSKEKLPKVTLFVTAFNEELFVDAKMQNSLSLNYPKDKLDIVWVTDGSDDNTNELLKKYPEAKVYFEPERRGKVHAMNRGMSLVEGDLVIFSDGNTTLGKDTVMEMVKKFQDEKVGCVAGEKRIELNEFDDAASSGEGIYWKYESWLKKLDGKVGSCIGAAGELFAVRKALFTPVNTQAILDDFMISMRLAMNGYRVAYADKAFAIEKASADVGEEMKRKIRIAAGSIQTLIWLLPLLNIFQYGLLSFQFISHKVFRWVVVPLTLWFALFLNIELVWHGSMGNPMIYQVLLVLQLAFYAFVLLGKAFEHKSIKMRFLFVPYYFFMANWAMWLGLRRYLSGKQSVNWERAKRAD